MDVSEASRWFNTVPVDGWNGTSWVRKVAYGDFHSFDRFITERTFGAKKRVFHTPDETRIDFNTYPVIRTPDEKIWIVTTDGADLLHTESYAHSYVILEVAAQADVIGLVSQTLSSGAPGPTTTQVLATYHCDLERYTARNSDTFNNVAYGSYEVTFSKLAQISVENELLIGGSYYEILEIAPELLTTVCRCKKRA